MRVLVTGHDGYIGTRLLPLLLAAGHDVTGLDSGLFADCTFGVAVPRVPTLAIDVRDVHADHLTGFDAIMHLAGISNDPLGDLNPGTTFDINHRASVRLAEQAKIAGVPRWIFASSCSNYGAAGDDLLDENSAFNPVTPYGESKVMVERDVSRMADDRFTPTFLRNATAYGVSSRLRADLVVNNLIGYAYTTGEVLIKSDGTPWRPLVHVEDIARAFIAVLESPRAEVHNAAFNVGRTAENYRVRALADLVTEVIPGSRVAFSEGAQPDRRNYRVNCDRIRAALPAFNPQWTVRRGMEELYDAYQRYGLTAEEFLGARYLRVRYVRELQRAGRLDDALRWADSSIASSGGSPA